MPGRILKLSDKKALQSEISGGKGAGLARLIKLGYRIPRGFIITVYGFEEFLDYNNIVFKDASLLSDNEISRLRDKIINGKIPRPYNKEVLKAFKQLKKPVAARSSMIGEDDILASCAGQLDTYLNIQSAEELLDSIRLCYSSLLNNRLKFYLENVPESRAQCVPRMAIVLQEMVDAKSAGVAFSADPITGQRGTLIEAVRGLGKNLVEGSVDPDRYRVDARGIISEFSLRDPEKPVLNRFQISMLNDYMVRLAISARMPVDVEWAWDDSDLYLLQIRPITSLVGKHIYSNRLVSDMIPGLIKPLLWSSNIRSMAVNVFGRLFTTLIGPNNYDFSLLMKQIHSRVYTDITFMGELLEKVGLPKNYLEVIARDEKSAQTRLRLSIKVISRLMRYGPFIWRFTRSLKDMRKFVSEHKIRLKPLKESDWSNVNERLLYDNINKLMEIHALTQWYVVVAGINMMIRSKRLGKFVKANAPDIRPQQLLRGLVGLKALEPNQYIQAMALKAKKFDVKAIKILAGGDINEISYYLSKSSQGRELLEDMRGFMDMFGFLSANGTDFSSTPWREEPEFIWKSVGLKARGKLQPAGDEIELSRRRSYTSALRKLSPVKRIRFKRILSSTKDYIDMRENISMLMSEDVYQMRRLILPLAERFQYRGIIENADDIFFLFIDEIKMLIEDDISNDEIQRRVSKRKNEYEADLKVEPSDTICGDKITYKSLSGFENLEFLVGICGSPGLVKGKARIVLDPSFASDNLSKDDILVVPFTDAGWTPIYTSIGGVIAETGGQLSHTSIIAREYGLPAIVSVKNATILIKDGQNITLNADEGKVYLK